MMGTSQNQSLLSGMATFSVLKFEAILKAMSIAPIAGRKARPKQKPEAKTICPRSTAKSDCNMLSFKLVTRSAMCSNLPGLLET